MPRAAADPNKPTGLASRLAAFVTERHPLALSLVLDVFDHAGGARIKPRDAAGLEALRGPFRRELARRLYDTLRAPEGTDQTTPGTPANKRMEQARAELVEACDGFLRREGIAASLTKGERLEILRGMALTRAVDNRLKQFFTSGEVRWGATAFPGTGSRSLGQEAIYAAGIRLRRGPKYRGKDGTWKGDVVAPAIRDAGVALAMRHDAEAVRMILTAQMGKDGPPMHGRDLHIGDFGWGVLPAAAPLGIGSLSVSGMAMAFQRDGAERVAVSFIGEGASSLGEWHEAINLCAARKLPAIFCLEHNQAAGSTPAADTSAVRVFADKAAGYGIPGISIDGTDPEAVAAAFAWAAERARTGQGPTLIEVIAMRMCGDTHDDDRHYLGKEQPPSWEYHVLHDAGYASRDLYEFWARRDPLPRYAARLEAEGLINHTELDRIKAWADALVEQEARAVIEMAWPAPGTVGAGVFGDAEPRVRVEVMDPAIRQAQPRTADLPPLEPGLAFDSQGRTFLDAVMLGIGDALRADPRVFVYGQDVGDRLIHAPPAASAVLGVCVGAALAGHRPIGDLRFNGAAAAGVNQLVNNAAALRYRWGADVPMVVRVPCGGRRSAGPYRSQNTESWFHRTPGLKIVVPSTPEDARALMAAAVADPDPVLYYEHLALYRDPRIRQVLPSEAPAPLPLGKAALRRAGSDVAIVSYGACVHDCLEVAEALSSDGIEAAVLDLRSLVPLDRAALLAVARHCSRVLIVHEDARTGGIGESLAAVIQEEAFESLDAPVRILGALDTPVPYAPPLEEAWLVSQEAIAAAARHLAAY